MPDVPTLAEAGYPNLTQIMGTSVWSTPDVPADIRNRMRQLLLKAVASQEVKSQLAALGMDAGNPAQTEAELQTMLKTENERTGKALKAMNYKP